MTAIPAGELKFRIQFQRPTVARGTSGTKTITAHSSLGYVRAKVLYGTGAERRTAGVENAVQTATFRCRANVTTSGGTVVRNITAQDRIVHAGLNWDIVAISLLPTIPQDIEFTAVANRG